MIIKIHLPIGLLLIALLCAVAAQAQDATFYEYPGVSSAEILRARGFQADEMFFTVSSGYRLRITRGRNPLIGHTDGKDPVLFVHGVLAMSNDFLLNSFNATPKDFSSINLANTSLSDLNERLANEPSAKSLPLLALNFGRDVWLVDRRGAPGSRELANKSSPAASQPTPLGSFMNIMSGFGLLVQQVPLVSAETRFWNYSLDDEARVDFPETCDFVLAQTGHTKLAIVSHSAGGAVALMSQSLFPERMASKISSAIYWAPAFSVSNENPQFSVYLASQLPLQENYIGPYPPIAVSMTLQNSLGLMCATTLAQETTCRALMTQQFGDGGGREPAKPEFISNQYFPSSSHELAQLSQQVNYMPRSMRMFNYGPEGNRRAYQTSGLPPAYDLRRIRAAPNTLSFISSTTDSQVTPADVATTLEQVQVAYKFRVIEEIPFSHLGYFFNTEAPRQVIIPSMRELETLPG